MSQSIISLKSRLDSRVYKLFLEQKFFDCILISPHAEYNSHRIILSKNCNWFLNYFQSSEPQKLQRVEIPVDPDGYFNIFLQFLYSSDLTITVKNISPLLKIATYYECHSFRKILECIFPSFVEKSTILTLAKQFSNLDIPGENFLISKDIADILIQILNRTPSPYTKNDIYESLSPSLLSSVLKEPIFHGLLSDSDKLDIIDEYVSYHTKSLSDINQFIKPSDRELLASIFYWGPEFSYNNNNNNNNNDSISFNDLIQRITRHNCDWFPPPLYRHIISGLISSRRSSLRSFSKEISKTQSSSFSRWYPFSWLSAIRESLPTNSSPQVSLVNMISSLGNEANLFNPQPYGILTTFSSVEPLSPAYDPRNILDNSSNYFLAYGKSFPAGVGLNLGPSTYFQPFKLILDSNIRKTSGTMKFIRISPAKLLVRAGEREIDVFEGNGKEIEMQNHEVNIELDGCFDKGYPVF